MKIRRELSHIARAVGEARWGLRQTMTDPKAPRSWWLTGYLAVFVLIPALMLIAVLRGVGFEDADVP